MYIERKYFNQYTYSPNISYISETLRILAINIRIAELELGTLRSSLAKSIERSYENLLIETERLSLSELKIELLDKEHKTNQSLYNNGFIDKDELLESAEELIKAKEDFISDVYNFNTFVKSLELKRTLGGSP